MLKQKNPLPSAECQLSLQDGNHLARPRQSHPQVARHVIWSLMGMDKIRRFFWCKAIKKRMNLNSAMKLTTEARWTQRINHLQKEYLEFPAHLEGESFSDPKIVTSP